MKKTGEYAKRSIPIFSTFYMMKARIPGPAYNLENVKRNFGVGPRNSNIIIDAANIQNIGGEMRDHQMEKNHDGGRSPLGIYVDHAGANTAFTDDFFSTDR